MISANGGLPAHKYTPQVTQRWPQGSETASVFGLGCRLRPATPGWGVRVCVRSCARSACTPPLLVGVCGVGVWASAWVSAAPRLCWLGCWCVCVCSCACSACSPPLLAGLCGVCVCVFGLGFWLCPATPGWGVRVCVCSCACSACTPPLLAGVFGVRVCLGSGVGCAPPLLAGVLGCVCVLVPAPPVPRHSWLGCAAWVCVLVLGFRLRTTTLGWGVGVCVCSCACAACSPPLLARVCGVRVCVWARVLDAPRHSWLGCLGVCVFVCALRLYPATPGRGVRCWCVCLGSGFGCAPPLLAGVVGCVCVFVCLLRLHPATPGWGVRRVRVFLGLGKVFSSL